MATEQDEFKNGNAGQTAASRLSSPTNIFPGNRLQGSSGSSGAPIRSVAASAPAAAAVLAQSTAGPSTIPTGGPKAPAPDGSQDRWTNTDVGRNVANSLAALPGVAGALPMIAKTGGAISSGLNAVSRLSNAGMGAGIGAAAAGPTLAPAAEPSGGPFPAATPPAAPSAAPAAVGPAAPGPGDTAAQTSAASGVSAVQPGVFQHGRGQYSDQAGGMGLAPGFTGQPNAQNMRAAENLASPPAGPQPGGAQPVAPDQVSAPTVQHSGNSWQARNDLRNLEVSASSITNRPGWDGAGMGRFARQPGTPPAVAAYQAGLQTDAALRQAQPVMDQAAMRENAGLQRTGMQERGASARAMGQLNLGQQRLGLDAQRAAGENALRSTQVRAADRMSSIQDQYLGAKTDEERARAASQIRGMNGQVEPAQWGVQVTPTVKNADGSTTEGSVYRYNKATGDVQPVTGGQRAAEPLPNHVSNLRKDPQSASQFDAIYGAGAAAKALKG